MATTRFIDHLLEGDHASRPAANAVPEGTLYSCTTHTLIYQSDGTSTWSTWFTGGVGSLDAIIAASSGEDIADALAGAAAPDAGNVFATMADVGGGSGLVLLEQHTASNSATLDFTTTISSTYDDYVFRFNGVIPATDGAMFTIRAGTGGGPTYDTGTNYPYGNFWKAVGDTTAVATWGTSGGGALSTFNDSVGGGFSNVSGTCGAGQINLFAPANTTNVKIWTWELVFAYYSDDKFYRVTGGGLYSPTTAMTAVRFLMSSGNIAAGTIRAYGVAK